MGMMKQYFEELNKYKKQYGEKVLLLWQCGFLTICIKGYKKQCLCRS